MYRHLSFPVLLVALVASVATSRPDTESSFVAWEAGNMGSGAYRELSRGEGFALEATLSLELPADEDGEYESHFEYGNALFYRGPFEMDVIVSDEDGNVLGEATYSDTLENDVILVEDVLVDCVAGEPCERTIFVDAEVVRGSVGVEWNLYVGARDVDWGPEQTQDVEAGIRVVTEE